jgi:hypothetical protein
MKSALLRLQESRFHGFFVEGKTKKHQEVKVLLPSLALPPIEEPTQPMG